MPARSVAPLRILITAGPTREYIDPVRYISNDSSGKMGFAIATAAAKAGHIVTIIAGPVALSTPPGVRRIDVISAADMLRACQREWRRHDVLIASAAVADYTPATPFRTKKKKTAADLVLRLKSTPDILATLSAAKKPGQTVIGFALEDRNVRKNAEGKLAKKGLDAIVLNRPTAIGADHSQIEILVRGEAWRTLAPADKSRHAAKLVRLVQRISAARRPRVR